MIQANTERAAGSRVLVPILLLTATVVVASLLVARPAHATTFTVNSTGDEADVKPGSGGCDTKPALSGWQCTLRAAIQEANATAGADTITFSIRDNPNIPGREVKTIQPNSELPEITDTVTIDGYTQPGSSPNTLAEGTNAKVLIELDGLGVSGEPVDAGLFIRGASDSVIKGLAIYRFSGSGIRVAPLFGPGPVTRVAVRNRIEGNFIGTDASGNGGLGNFEQGILISGAGSTVVGGTSPAERNVISGNESQGVLVKGGMSAGTKVLGNLIGTRKDGVGNLGNARSGVSFFNVSSTSTTGNIIAFNGLLNLADADGVKVTGGESNGILRNSIFSNEGLGIDLMIGVVGGDGPTANDPGDPDTGSNNLQNKPVITSGVTSGGSTTIQGKLNSTPNRAFVIRFFSNPAGENEGKKFIGQKSVNTNSNGNVGFSFSPATAVPTEQTITATATSSGGDTSEFSAPRTVVRP